MPLLLLLLLLLLVKDGTYLANGRRPARKHGSTVCHWPPAPCDQHRRSNLLEFFEPRRKRPRASLRKKGSTQMNVQSSLGRTNRPRPQGHNLFLLLAFLVVLRRANGGKRKKFFFYPKSQQGLKNLRMAQPLLAGRPGKMGQLAAGRAAAVVAVALCVCAALFSSTSMHDDTDELYLSVPLQLSPGGQGQARLADGSTMLATISGPASSVLEARQEQVKEDDEQQVSEDDNTQSVSHRAGPADEKAEREREEQGEKEDAARAQSSDTGNDEDAEGAPDEDKDAAGDDGYVHDFDLAPSHSLAGEEKQQPAKKEGEMSETIKPYDPEATLELTTGEKHYGLCQGMRGKTLEALRHQSAPSCPSYEALTKFKYTGEGCSGDAMRASWKCASSECLVSHAGQSRMSRVLC